MTPIRLAIFLLMNMAWQDNFNFLHMMTTIHFASFTFCILIWFMTIPSVQREMCFGVSNIKLVLLVFKDSIDFSYFFIHVSDHFFKFSFRAEKIGIISKENWYLKGLDTFVKSLIYRRNNTGPSMDPWGTSHLINCSSDVCPLCMIDCWWLDK